MSESAIGKEIEDVQHLVNTDSTDIQQPLNVGLREKAQTLDEEIDSEAKEFIQQTTKDRGERGYVEQGQFDSVLQNTPKQEKKSVERRIKRLPNKRDGQNPFQVGEQIVDVLTKIRGVVVGIEGEKVIFNSRELGRVWRKRELLMKIG